MRPKNPCQYHEGSAIQVTVVPIPNSRTRRPRRKTIGSVRAVSYLTGQNRTTVHYQKTKTTAFTTVNSKHLRTPLRRGTRRDGFVPGKAGRIQWALLRPVWWLHVVATSHSTLIISSGKNKTLRLGLNVIGMPSPLNERISIRAIQWILNVVCHRDGRTIGCFLNGIPTLPPSTARTGTLTLCVRGRKYMLIVAVLYRREEMVRWCSQFMVPPSVLK